MIKTFHFLLCLLFFASPARADETDRLVQSLFGAEAKDKFSLHTPVYFLAGPDDLKIQFGFKYRLAKSFPLYTAYSQLMFWDIYGESKPFNDVNYRPEVFYRLIENLENSLATLDMGWSHLSNGQKDVASRSLDQVFLRANYFTKFTERKLNLTLKVHQIYNEDDTNHDVINHLGYWDLSVALADLMVFESSSLALEFRTYAGSKIFDLDQGATQIGLALFFESKNFNPSIYFQRFEGYAENLLNYDKSRTHYRLGLNLTF